MNRLATPSNPGPQTLLRPGLLAVLLALTACGPSDEEVATGDDPLAALAVPVPSTRYTGEFWWRDHAENPDRFERAVAYCEGKSLEAYPNCAPVLQARNIIGAARSPRIEGKTYTGIAQPPAPDSTGFFTADSTRPPR